MRPSRRMDPERCEEGYDYEFVPPLNHKYECPICLSALREPHQTSCGHRFCRSCILRWIRESCGRCPVDNEPVTEKTVYPDNFAKREILALNVRCPNRKHGCDVICELRDMKKHEDNCDFVRIPCPNACGDLVFKKELTQHMQFSCKKRLIHCTHCSQRIEADHVQLHSNECPMMKTSCSHCQTLLTRCEMVQHLNEDCPMVVVPCLFTRMGCKAEIKRNDVDSHMEDYLQFHMRLAGQTLNSLMHMVDQNDLSASLSTSTNTSSLQTLRLQSGSLERLLSGVQQLSVVDSGVVTTASSIVSENTRSLAAYTPQDYMTESCSPMSSIPEAASIQSLHSGVHSTISTSYVSKAADSSVRSEPALESISRTQEELMSIQKQQCLTCKQRTEDLQNKVAKLEYALQEERSANKNLCEMMKEIEAKTVGGVKIWPIHNYSRLRREAQNGQTTVLHSDGFYTSYYGYKICLRINLNGVDTAHGTHLSLFIHFMKGEFDDFLDWPFNGRIILSILDQNEISEQRHHMTESLVSKPKLAAFQKPVTNRNHKGFGYMEFVPLSVIDNSTLVKNDTLIIKAEVTVNSGES